MYHLKGESDFVTSINRETFTDIIEENELFVEEYNNTINVTKMKISRNR